MPPKKLYLHNIRNQSATRNQSEIMNLAETLSRDLQSQTYECMVCFDRIKLNHRIWSCNTCWAVFHMKCINQWAAVNRQSGADWNCPGCNTVKQEEAPNLYFCFCSKKRDPVVQKGIPAHSCGQICEKSRFCSHPCEMKCHPGPCPDCKSLRNPVSCACGKQLLKLPCSTLKMVDFVPTCEDLCGKLLNCGVHTCQLSCHTGYCQDCRIIESAKCFCGKETKNIVCGESKLFSCESACDKTYSCGEHVCERKCHQHDNTAVCIFDPSIVTTCPCGKKKCERKSCRDDIPLCGKPCLKSLICGHACKEPCHFGECPPCPLYSDKMCRCKKSFLSLPCKNLDFDRNEGKAEVLCQKNCKVKLPCKRHTCDIRCCSLDKSNHVCERLCGKLLSCKSHTCLMICSHDGDCHDCVEGVSFDELSCSCGATVMYPPIPCGTAPPECNRICRKSRPCGHRQITSHRCHPDSDDCPPCMVFKSVWCACGASELKNIPCSRSTIPSCGKPCIKVCPDCNHPCSRVCHAGACVDTTHPCVRKCGRTRSCGHICQYKCHGVSECLEDEPCRQILKVVCNCGSKKKTIQCGTGKGAAAKAALFLLACDQSCEKKLIMERMKHALDIDPSNTFLPFAGWQENTVKLAISFPELVINTEKQLLELINSPTIQYFYFPKQRLSKANSLIQELCEAYGFIGDWVDQKIGKGTVIARRQPGRKATVPPKLLSQVAKSYNPSESTKDPFILISPETMVKAYQWTQNGFFISGISLDAASSDFQNYIGNFMTGEYSEVSLFWLDDQSCFVLWDRNKSVGELALGASAFEKPVESEIVQEMENLTGGNEKSDKCPEESLGTKITEINEDVLKLVPSKEEVLLNNLKERGWATLVVPVSISPLGGLTTSDGRSIGHAKKRSVTSLRGYLESDWTEVANWKKYLIPLFKME